jgi:hypothetical protein
MLFAKLYEAAIKNANREGWTCPTLFGLLTYEVTKAHNFNNKIFIIDMAKCLTNAKSILSKKIPPKRKAQFYQ